MLADLEQIILGVDKMERRTLFVAVVFLGVCLVAVLGAPASKQGRWKYQNTRRIGNCSFEMAMCKWTNLKRSTKHNFEFDWTRQRYRTPSAGTGPVTGAHGSYYMYIESSSPRKPGDEAALANGPYDGIMCMTFHYHMYGGDIGALEIYVDDRSEFGNTFLLWKLRKNQGNAWRQANVTVYGKYYFVLFVGRIGTGYRGDVAIDKITFADGTCNNEDPAQLMRKFNGPPVNVTIAKGSCEFNDGTFCEWRNDKFEDQFDWWLKSGRTGATATGPRGDWTGRKGMYAFIESSSPRRRGDTARLLSPMICGRVCMRFYYNMYGTGTGALDIFRREGFGNAEKQDRVWFRKGNQGPGWRRDMVEFNSDEQCYKAIIQATRGPSYLGDIAIDGIVVRAGSCCKIRSELNILRKNGNCNFKSGFCGWKNSLLDKFDWQLSNGSTPSKQTGPQNYRGGYIFIEASEPRIKGDNAVLVSGVLHGSLCMRFRYHMYGEETGSLKVYRNGDGVFQQLLWQRSGNQGNVWRSAAVTIDCSVKSYFIELEGVRGTGWRGDIAVDKIVLENGRCPPGSSDPVQITKPTTTPKPDLPPQVLEYEGFCDFNNGFCYWENDIADEGDWTRHQWHTSTLKTGPSEGYGGGFYLYAEASDMRAGDIARLLLNAPLKGKVCIKTMYHMYGAGMGNLTIDMKEKADKTWTTKWNMTGNNGNLWRQAAVTIKGKDYTVSIAAMRGSTFESDIALDSLEIFRGSCEGSFGASQSIAKIIAPYNCNFEKGNILGSNWKQDKSDQFDWDFRSGGTPSSGTGPERAYTTGRFYAYTESSSPRNPGDKARLTLRVQVDTTLCMRFFYHMLGNGMGTLRVYTIQSSNNMDFKNANGVLLVQRGQPKVDPEKWKEFQKPFSVAKDVTIVIEGERGRDYTSDMAIDDIQFSPGDCAILNGGKRRQI